MLPQLLLLGLSGLGSAGILVERAAAPLDNPVNVTDGWEYGGCFTDDVNGRTLAGANFQSNTLTDQSCVSFCAGKGYAYAGSEYSGECYCGNRLKSTAWMAPATDCNMACSGNSSQACGGPNRLTLYNNTLALPSAGPFVNPGVGKWTSAGCFNDTVNGRTLPVGVGVNGAMTISKCLDACAAGGYVLAGAEYAGECFCGNALENYGALAADSSTCSMTCSGNSSEYCGGPNRLNLYTTLGWHDIGCYNDSVATRTLSFGQNGNAQNMTTEYCQGACQAAGYTIAGTEYGGECYCDNAWKNGGAPTTDGGDSCNMPCNGNSLESCGGPNRMNAYTYLGPLPTKTTKITPASSAAPATSSPVVVASSAAPASTTAVSSDPPVSSAASAASSAAPTSAAPVTTSATSAADPPATSTTDTRSLATTNAGLPSTVSTGDVVSASDGVNTAASTPSSSVSVAPSSVSPVSAVSAAPSPTSTGTAANDSLPYGFTYKGCYVDNAIGRIFINEIADTSTMTVESCIKSCGDAGYVVAGLEYASQCFCDNFVRNNGSITTDSDCNMPCSGNNAEMCGAGNRLSVYSNVTTLKIYAPPAIQKTDLPGEWSYAGCMTDNGDSRTLPWQLIFDKTNSAQTCLTACQEFGYNAAGMEFGRECYCGDPMNIAASPSTLRPDSECGMVCPGNATTLCGDGNRLATYVWNGTDPLSTFSYPTGNDAGAYEFLIGGVIIPLVVSAAKNGKVTFVEKWGTGPPNTTGAYELDLAQIDNFTAAWRPMHVKTDVFCSASLTLPDKGARQINIGGWSYDSTYGVRLYWPDGKPGVWGSNDWQENVDEVALQAGRWYPSAMVMANGSILVVGGEAGSNGAPVPSLELLPRVGGTQYCDYLEQSDPYNLYPFLYVLPSGGIFIGYYNEARILDEVTLQTKTILPTMPGAVNDPTGGRTYPFEGTSMLMPQHAPYTDPLTILICGGSIPGGQGALDNCVSIQPDVPGAKWAVERMPSKRVMSCMTALPDGTYLILNGAQRGVAGFGLASQPNLNAVLYDPSKPLNGRMSVMANTTVARLYHSEAVLLDDGRVLVSGSDPEDQVNPQEYRVEVFVPPYLLNGAVRPEFTIANTDWTYGSSYTFTITQAPSVTVSLIGAVGSTHGNSMGQRTLFPAVSCSGNTCTVTAPPDRHICPPGWFQMFVLNNGVPSHATWVRIGGDPAALGNWPPYSDFTVPGV